MKQSIWSYLMLALALVVAGCGGEDVMSDGAHTSDYFALRKGILQDADTSDFDNRIRLFLVNNKSDASNDYMPDMEADVLQAMRYRLAHDSLNAVNYAQKVISAYVAKHGSDVKSSQILSDMEFVIGDVYSWSEDSAQQGIEHLQRSLDLIPLNGSALQHVLVRLRLARLYYQIGDLSSGLAHISVVEAVVDTATDNSMNYDQVVSAYSECACLALDICDRRQAERILTNASAVLDKASDDAKIKYLMQVVRLRMIYGQFSQASTALNRVEMLLSKSGDNKMLADVYLLQGLSRSRMGELLWAEQFLEKSDTAALSFPHSLNVEYFLLRGEIKLLQHNYKEAKAFLFDSVDVMKTSMFEGFMIRESQRSYSLSQDMYEQAYNLLQYERKVIEMMLNDVFVYGDRKRAEVRQSLEDERDRQFVELRTAYDKSRKAKYNLIVGVLFVVVLLLIATIFYVRRVSEKAKNKVDEINANLRQQLGVKIGELERQKSMLHAAQMRMSDSIAYAEHIQRSMSPDPNVLNTYPISGSFIFYSPLDVVSGDFYWFTRKDDNLIVCCADCTGHGVPGALMAMIATTILNDICDRLSPRTFADPSAILEDLDRILIENLAHNRTSSGASKDGLDVSVSVLNLLNHTLTVAAARRPVIVVKGDELIVVKGTKRCVGELDPGVRARKFENTTFQLDKGDKFYQYTDGYSDQFGGANGDKLKSTKIEKFISAIHNDDMDEQSLTIQEFFIQWKGDFPQTDDVLFLGVEV